MLLGDACSNLFDGTRTLGGGGDGDALTLRGVERAAPVPVGLLCHAEASNLCEVGQVVHGGDQDANPVLHCAGHLRAGSGGHGGAQYGSSAVG